MKLALEINEERFIYSYEVGEEKFNSSRSVTTRSMTAFSDILRACSEILAKDTDNIKDEVTARVWISKNQNEARKLVEEQKQREQRK